jgi:hypothetical protein
MRINKFATRLRLGGIIVCTLSVLNFKTSVAYAVDASPGAYIPIPAGSNLAMLYLGGSKASEYQPTHGKSISNGTELKTKTGLVRLFHMFEVDGHRLQLQFGLPFGRQDLKFKGVKVGHDGGFSDPYVAISAWPIDDPAHQRYLAVTAYAQFPGGTYDNKRSLNMGNNRYANAIQVGYSQAWGAWRLELNQDVTWYHQNDEYGATNKKLNQEPTYNFQPWLSYTFDNKVTTSVGFARVWGGESDIDGVSTDRRTDYLRARAGVGYWLKKNVQVYSELNRDVEVRGGYKFDYTGFVRLAVLF